MRYATTAHYLMYWKLTPYERQHLEEKSARYVASNQLDKVHPGDVLWVVNVYLGELWLLGRIHVETIVSDSEIAQELADISDVDWVEADWYAIANRYHVEPLREVNLTGYLSQLKFAGKSEKVRFVEGRLEANQFRALRELHPKTAKLIEQIWYDTEDKPEPTADFIEITEDAFAYTEGKKVTRTLEQRQRNRQLVNKAKRRFKKQHGKYFCVACGFDFEAFYGREYIEAHHTKALSEFDGEEITHLDDLAMLCANCHRIVHTQTPPLTIDKLIHLIKQQQARH